MLQRKSPMIMGIVNCTPDSFYEKSRCRSLAIAYEKAKDLIKQGADILDIGGESSRPFADAVSEDEEIERTIPLIKKLSHLDKLISIDTVKPKVAVLALENGAKLINDISGFSSPEMTEIAATYSPYICVMHMQKTPKTMQINPCYKKGVVYELLKWFEKKLEFLIQKKINPSKIIIDPGIGFGKSLEDNLNIIKNIKQFQKLGFKTLLGISRKSFMGKITNKKANDLLFPTLYFNTYLLQSGIDIIRVHDVAEHKNLLDIRKKLSLH